MKLYRISSIAEQLGIESSTLRFWEKMFPELCPVRTERGQRRYREAEVHKIRGNREQLHERGMNIEGARRKLKADRERVKSSDSEEKTQEILQQVYEELLEVRQILKNVVKE